MSVNGTVALVTGAGQGIGAAVAEAFAKEGAAVAVTDIREERAAATASRLPVARAYPLDVRDPDACEGVVARVEHELGPIGVLANVAGVLLPGKVLDVTDDDWAATFAVNATGVLHMSRSVAHRMVSRGAGSIVTVGSNAAGVPRVGMAAYAAAKAAATMFTRCLGLELAGHGIRCNVVAPGSTDTPMQRALWTDTGADGVIAGSLDGYRTGIPLGRIADPADVADAVVYLASDRARHVTMQTLYVDGGASLVA